MLIYLQAIQGTARLTGSMNPATWVLQATAACIEQELSIDFAEIYAASAMHRHESIPQQG